MATNWSTSWTVNNNEVNQAPPEPSQKEQEIVLEAKERFKLCVNWEATARLNFEYDYKFANGDSHNKYQWENDLYIKRETESRPCLTINKTAQHNLMVINDSKQNKPGIRIRPVGDESSYDSAQIFQELIYHIEYISNAENVYDAATEFQVQAGMGYWRVKVEYPSSKSFDQEIYIRPIKDPRSVYLDYNINERDGSDAWYGFVFDDLSKSLFKSKYPKFADLANHSVLGESARDGWITQDKVRVAEYFRKTQKRDKLVTWTTLDGIQIIKYKSDLNEQEKEMYDTVTESDQNKELFQFRERKVIKDEIEWFLIAGDRIIDSGPWLGKYIPIVRLPGIETVIDGVYDFKGHTRALIDPQRMYNWNASADVEYGALQTKVPWIAASAAIEGYEEYYKTANTTNHAYLPYNAYDDDGNQLPPPQRPPAPQPSPAYVQRMQISINEMMMASGQFQSQTGENENAKSGVAINARQRQGDRATYHFLDSQAMAIRLTGRICLDLITKIYDTKRIQRITSRDGTVMNVTIDPKAPQALQELATNEKDKTERIRELVFNPNVGEYDIQSDTGPSYATRRMEAFNALTQIAAQNKDFMNIGGDLYFKVADFPEADILAQRYRRAIPKSILGEAPDPNTEAAMQAAGDKIQELLALVTDQSRQLKDKDRELDLKEKHFDLEYQKAGIEEIRQDFKTLSEHIKNLGNSGPGVSVEQIQPLIQDAIRQILGSPDLDVQKLKSIGNGGTSIQELANENTSSEV